MPDISLQQLLSTNFSLSPSGYTGSQGAIGYTGSAGTGGSGDAAIPKITNIQVTDNTYTVLDDTAVALTGGYIKITGTGFASGCQVLVGTTAATSTTFVSSTEVRAQIPATVLDIVQTLLSLQHLLLTSNDTTPNSKQFYYGNYSIYS